MRINEVGAMKEGLYVSAHQDIYGLFGSIGKPDQEIMG